MNGTTRPDPADPRSPLAGAARDVVEPGGSQGPAEGHRLARPPGERYLAGGDAARGRAATAPDGRSTRAEPAAPLDAGPGRAGATAALVAAGGGVLLFGLGLLDLGAGLVAVAGGIGWATGLGLHWGGGGRSIGSAGSRAAIAGGLAAVAVTGALLGIWAWSRGEGGVLGPADYLGERFGVLAPLEVAVAGLIGALRGR